MLWPSSTAPHFARESLSKQTNFYGVGPHRQKPPRHRPPILPMMVHEAKQPKSLQLPVPAVHVPFVQICPAPHSASLQHIDPQTQELPVFVYPGRQVASHAPWGVHVGAPFCTAAQAAHVCEAKHPDSGVFPVQVPAHKCSEAPHIDPPELLLDELLLDELLLDELLPDELLPDADPLDELLDETSPLDELLDAMALPPSPLDEPPAPPSPPAPAPLPKSVPVPVAHAPTNSNNAAKPNFSVLTLASAHLTVRQKIFTQFIRERKAFHVFSGDFQNG